MHRLMDARVTPLTRRPGYDSGGVATTATYDAAAAATPVPIGQDTPVPPSPQ